MSKVFLLCFLLLGFTFQLHGKKNEKQALIVRAIIEKEKITIVKPFLRSKNPDSRNEEYSKKVKKYHIVSVNAEEKILQERNFDFVYHKGKGYDCPFGYSSQSDSSGCISTDVDAGTIYLYLEDSPKIESIQIFKDGKRVAIEKLK